MKGLFWGDRSLIQADREHAKAVTEQRSKDGVRQVAYHGTRIGARLAGLDSARLALSSKGLTRGPGLEIVGPRVSMDGAAAPVMSAKV